VKISVSKRDNVCFGSAEGSLEILAQGDGTYYQYSIDSTEFQDSNRFDNLLSGSYFITVLEDSVCWRDYGTPVDIGQPDSIHIEYTLRPPECQTCRDGKIILAISGGIPPYQVALSGVPGELVTETLGIGSYTLVVTDANSCTKTLEFSLELSNVVPNVITTNGDGVNDLWKIPMLKYFSEATVRVYNMAGRQVFWSPPGYPVPWDGRENGNYLPMGTYYYLINLGPGERQITGYLTILR
jgi:gliding motility-associated-like protein